jgi:hypothetical protein
MNKNQVKREVEQKVWAILKANGKIPNTTTKEGYAEYMKIKRQVERQVKQHYSNFFQFLLYYDASYGEIVRLLNSDIMTRHKKRQ